MKPTCLLKQPQSTSYTSFFFLITDLRILVILPNFVLSSQFARQYSRNEPLTFAWLRRYIKWPLLPPKNIKDLMDLEAVHDVFDLYLWLRYNPFPFYAHSFLAQQSKGRVSGSCSSKVERSLENSL